MRHYWADYYSDVLGLDPQLIVPGKQVALIRQQRAEQQAKMMQMEQAKEMASVAKDSERLKPPFPRLRCRLCRETFSQPPPSRSWGSSRVIDPVGA